MNVSFPYIDDGLRALAKNCENLVSLNIEGCLNVTDHGASYLSKYCSQMRSINVSYCYQLTDKSLERLLQNCPLVELESKGLDDIWRDDTFDFDTKLQNLGQLNLQGCTGVMSDNLSQIIKCFPTIFYVP